MLFLAWKNLLHSKAQTLAAAAGIAFSNALIFMQLGLYASVESFATLVYDKLNFDLILVSPDYFNFTDCKSIPAIRIQQARQVAGVQTTYPFHATIRLWRNVETGGSHPLQVFAFRPGDPVFDMTEVDEALPVLGSPESVLMDKLTLPKFGPRDPGVVTELNRRQVRVVGEFTMGITLGAEGHVICGDAGYARILGTGSLDTANFGLIKLAPGADRDKVLADLRASLPSDVNVQTREEIVEYERRYWTRETSIGIILAFGAGVAFVVGSVVLYQVLSSNVTNHFTEFATLKALGFRERDVNSVVLYTAALLAIMSFLPALFVSLSLYAALRNAAHMPIDMTWQRMLFVFALSFGTCATSGMIIVRRVRNADPADLF